MASSAAEPDRASSCSGTTEPISSLSMGLMRLPRTIWSGLKPELLGISLCAAAAHMKSSSMPHVGSR